MCNGFFGGMHAVSVLIAGSAFINEQGKSVVIARICVTSNALAV